MQAGLFCGRGVPLVLSHRCNQGAGPDNQLSPTPHSLGESARRTRAFSAVRSESRQAVAAERPVFRAVDDMAVPVLNGNVEGSLQWKAQLSQPDLDIQAAHRRPSTLDNREVLDLRYTPPRHHLSTPDLWTAVRAEAREFAEVEPMLASQVHTQILVHSSFGKAMAHMLGNKLSSPTILGTQLVTLIKEVYAAEPGILEACAADVQAVFERDPSCNTYAQCILNFKGFQALQTYRVAHYLWLKNRRALALTLQSRVSEVFQVDIHPAASLGWGFMMDHATGIVIGETATVGHNVSILHQVTLGGSGTGRGWRHPTIGHGVLLGAGTCVLGPVTVGDSSKIGAGSVVVTNLPSHCVAVGVPARVIKRDCTKEPCKDMNFVDDFILDYQI